MCLDQEEASLKVEVRKLATSRERNVLGAAIFNLLGVRLGIDLRVDI